MYAQCLSKVPPVNRIQPRHIEPHRQLRTGQLRVFEGRLSVQSLNACFSSFEIASSGQRKSAFLSQDYLDQFLDFRNQRNQLAAQRVSDGCFTKMPKSVEIRTIGYGPVKVPIVCSVIVAI